MLVPINLAGGTFKHKSLPLSAQVTRNFWPQKQEDEKAKSSYVMASFAGLTLFGTASGADRGMFEHRDVLYKVTGTTLYSVNSAGTHTSLGTIPDSTRCIFAPIGTSLVIVTNGHVYIWNGTVITEVTDSDLESPNSAAHLNNQIIYDGDQGRYAVSDVSDAATINSLNYGTAEAVADDSVRVFSYNQTLFVFGKRSIEPFWNDGSGNPPFTRVETGIVNIGLAALHSVASNDSYIYFLGDDDQVYAMQGYNAVPISPLPLSRTLSEYDVTEDAFGFCFTHEGRNFYLITFPTENKSWIYQEGGEWFELSSGTDGGRWIANSHAFCYRKNLLADYRNGNIYELDGNTYTENGATIIRTRVSPPLHGALLGAQFAGKTIEMSRFELIMETGVGLLSGQGSDPVVMLSFSDDGGRTWSTEMWGQVGALGEYQKKVEWYGLGRFESRLIKISCSDPVDICIHSAAAEMDVCI